MGLRLFRTNPQTPVGRKMGLVRLRRPISVPVTSPKEAILSLLRGQDTSTDATSRAARLLFTALGMMRIGSRYSARFLCL
ncbi:hypothetical protein BD324DRAFT_629924 [Kockovaella imperatae]|uniref:Uncharacterized protein n=1 Tax=Kockovaella imperatae TaxID=4999 RepID=A0A1Y1UEV2_9TREE|nr:hypothetical protein BD324DRAFT_629924 [Kockovaella imperatae]ORX36036.1 hypothetical protein BD324DRAFT_629924 [Kockovaella imperatae]